MPFGPDKSSCQKLDTTHSFLPVLFVLNERQHFATLYDTIFTISFENLLLLVAIHLPSHTKG